MTAPVNYRSSDFAPPSSSALAPPTLTRVAPPPLPPRPAPSLPFRPSPSSFSLPAYSSPYSSSFLSPYSYGYGGGYGGAYGYGHAPFHRPDDHAPSSFVQRAEESSRGAFESVQSIVQAFASVSMMMEATFSAVYNSFRAVLDVANHFSRLRAHLTRVLSALALVRTLRFLYRRLQRALGRRFDSEVDDLWTQSANETVNLVTRRGANEETPKSWPIFLFFSVVLGGPYLIWKLLSSTTETSPTETEWASGDDDHVVARAEFDFSSASDEEISFRAGDTLHLAPRELQPRVRGWLLASVDGSTIGLVPANYVKILGKRRGRRRAEAEGRSQNQSQVLTGVQSQDQSQVQTVEPQRSNNSSSNPVQSSLLSGLQTSSPPPHVQEELEQVFLQPDSES